MREVLKLVDCWLGYGAAHTRCSVCHHTTGVCDKHLGDCEPPQLVERSCTHTVAQGTAQGTAQDNMHH